MSSLVWSPDPDVHRRAVTSSVEPRRLFSEDDKGRSSPRKQLRFNRFSKISWSREQVFLALVFVAALLFGYVASTLLWQLEGLGTGHSSGPGHPAHRLADSKKYMDKLDAKAKKGLFANAPQDPPYTRSKYLEYFRSIHYGEASLQRHGGNRRVDIQMARELSTLYARHAAGRATGNKNVEDDLWTEVRYEGSPASNHVQRDLEHEQVLWERLDVLIRRELEYDPHSLPAGIYSDQRSSMAFKQEVPESLSIASRDRMCSSLEHSLGPPIDQRRRILFILGAQKAGTTYLFNALTKHPAFVGASHAFGQRKGPWAKEVHFFNRWPLQKTAKMDYISCFPPNTWKLPAGGESPHYTLVDATPDYMFNSMAAPRIKAMWPNAKFVVILRDPIARTYSAWKMSKKMACRDQAKTHPTEPCVYPVFAEMVLAEAALLEKQGCAFSRKGQLHPKAWDDCYHCKFTFANETVCKSFLKWDKQPCHAPPFLTLSVSMYAAQLSWWFAHLPKENFMFVTSSELRKGDPIETLNKVVQFMDMPIPNFRQDMLKNVWGYNGGYNKTELTPLDLHTVRFLDLFFRQSNLDLAELLKDHSSFFSIPPEIEVPVVAGAE